MRKIFSLLLCLILTLAACAGPTSAPASPPIVASTPLPPIASRMPPTPVPYSHSTCADYARINIGNYTLHNNVWNKRDRTDYTQCIFTQNTTLPTTMGWRWNWPGTRGEIQAYPEVMFGDSPWDTEPPTGGFPLPVSNRDLLVTYTATISATGKWNVAFDLWLTDAPAPAAANITDEIMIWVDANDLMPGPQVYDIVAFDGITYTVHIAPGHGDASGGSSATWTYIAFKTRRPLLSATLNMGHFLGYLLEKQVIGKERYLASLEFGTELASGQGEFVLERYEIALPTSSNTP